MSKTPTGGQFVSREEGNQKCAVCVLSAHLCVHESHSKAFLINIKSLPPFFFKKGRRELKWGYDAHRA